MKRLSQYLIGLVFLVITIACGVTKEMDLPLPLKSVSEQILYRKGYVVSYNKDTKLPNWVAWHLTADHVDGDVK